MPDPAIWRNAVLVRSATSPWLEPGVRRRGWTCGPERPTLVCRRQEIVMNAGSRVKNVVLVHGGFVDGSGWQAVYRPAEERRLRRQHRPEPDPVARRRRRGHPPGHRRPGRAGRPGRPLLRRRGDHRGRQPRQRGGARLHRRVRARQGRVGEHAHRRSAARAHRCRRSCRPRTASSSWTGRSSRRPSPPTCRAEQAAFMADSQVPWGVDALGGSSRTPPGGRSRAGTSSRPTTG